MANKKLSAILTIGGTVAATLRSSLTSTKTQIDSLGKSITDLSKRQRLLGSSINTFGKLGKDIDGLRSKYANVTAELDRMRAAQMRFNNAQARTDRLKATAGSVARAGVVVGATGAAMMAPAVMGIKEAKHYDTEKARITALGMGDETNKKAFEFAKSMKTYGTSQLENLEFMKDGLSIFADLHHAEIAAPTLAKMKFANRSMFGDEQGGKNTDAFMDMMKVIELRGGANSDEVFGKQANMVQKVISATGGRVQGGEWRNVMSTGGIAAKLMRDDAFYYQLEPLVQMMGGDKVGTGLSASYSSLYQGRTTKRAAGNLDKYGLIGDKSKVENDKVGQVAHINPGALLGSKLFRESQYEWIKQIFIPQMAKKGVTDDKELADVLASIVSNRKGADLLAAMVLQQKIIDKDIHRNAGAHDIDTLDKEGRDTAAGKEIELEKQLADAKLRMGTQVLPLYISMLTKADDFMERLNGFIDKNPNLAKDMAIGITAIGGALVVLAPLLIVGSGLLTAYAAIQLRVAANAVSATAAIEAQGVAATTTTSLLGGLLKRIGAVLIAANVADYVAGKFGVGGKEIDQSQDDKNWDKATTWGKIRTSIPRSIETVGRFIGMSNISNQAQAGRIAQETEYLNGSGNSKPPPTLPSLGVGASGYTSQDKYEFNITQKPDQSTKDLADEIMKKIKERDAVNNRSRLYDGANAQ